MNLRLSGRIVALVSLAAAVVLFVSINVVAGNWLADIRLDLTQEGLYTLSPATRATLAKIDEPITLRFYYSPQLGREIPTYGVFADRVREMLREYAALANGKVKLQFLDPEPFSPVEDRAVAFGLQGVPLDQSGEQVYFGLAGTNSTDDQAIVPFFQPDRERFLEYDLTKLIAGLANPHKTVVGLATALPLEGDLMAAMQGRPLVPYVVLDQMRQLYDVRSLGIDFDKVPSGIDVLMLVHPQNLSDKTLYAIDQFVLKGGRALVFVDPDSETQRLHPSQLNPPGMPNDSNLDKLFAAWGLRLVPKMVAADRADAQRVKAGNATDVQPVDYVGWLTLKTDNLNRDNPITADLSQLNVATPGILEPLPGAKTAFTPLITTSTDSMEIPADKFQAPDPAALLTGFKPDGKELVVAAQITGPAKTAFPGGPPKSADKDKATATDAKKPDAPLPAQLKAAVKPIEVVAVADTDILDDRFWVQVQNFFGQRIAVPTANNGDFVTDAIDVLSGGADLIGLRTRGTAVRPFELVQNIQRATDERYQASEKALEDKLKDTEQKLKDLRDKGSHQAGMVDAAQNEAIENFRGQLLATRRQLRQVQLAEREDINRLQTWLEFFDIALIPILVAVVAMAIGAVRMRRRRRRAETG
ncbi:MAG: Gldg family protein [Alphaproteobacteria bacterium]|nr:Gldg family protein [Alphaproteobacteria bacterium]